MSAEDDYVAMLADLRRRVAELERAPAIAQTAADLTVAGALDVTGSITTGGNVSTGAESTLGNATGEHVEVSEAAGTTTLVAGGVDRVTAGSTGTTVNGPLGDQAGRWFLRTDLSRGGTQLIQYGQTSIATDANGDMTVTFPESFGDLPTCTATIQAPSSSQRTAQIQGSPSTTAVTFRLMVNGAPAANATTGTLHWFATGFKDMT